MDYLRIYNSLIDRSRTRMLDGYVEKHHIIPKCMGGSDDKNNISLLTPEEHYVAHQLLVKIYPKNNALIKAAQMMIPNRPSNKLYGWLRRRFSEVQSASQKGSSNSQHGTRWIHNAEAKISKKIPKLEPLPNGWQEGRRVKFRTATEELLLYNQRLERNRTLRELRKQEKKRLKAEKNKSKLKTQENKQKSKTLLNIKNREYAKFLFDRLISGEFKSIRELARSDLWDKSDVSLISFFKKYITDYNNHVVERQQKFGKVN